MAPKPGTTWSKNPLTDKLQDERAVDMDIADLLERAATVLRSRQCGRRRLDEALGGAQKKRGAAEDDTAA